MLPAAAELIRRLSDERPGVQILLTAPEAGDVPRKVLRQLVPTDELVAGQEFLAHWRPDVAAFVGGALEPALMQAVHLARVPLFLVDANPAARGLLRWLPGAGAALLRPCAGILASDAGAVRALRQIGGGGLAVQAAGRLEAGIGALPYTEAEREAMARLLQTRPVWLAAGLPSTEVALVIEAHRAALRLAHRLLLIVVPQEPAEAMALAERMQAEQDWMVALRSTDDDLDEECQVYIGDTEGEYGLWYRLAPITYMGGTLLGEGSTHSPFEPAALGSAVIHGPRAGDHAAAYERLRDARATREIRLPGELGEALGDLLSPDRAALIAHNAWAAASSGAEVTDRVAQLLLDALDARGAS